jgi:signal transduction histidine kinase
VLCSVAGRDEYRDSQQLQALVRRQLPMVAQRLAETLDRLQRPEPERETYVTARQWWDDLVRQHRGGGIEFEAVDLPVAARLPRSLFDSVAGNLIGNALAKRAAEPATRVRVALACGKGIVLRVTDSGSAVAPEVEPSLLRAPVSSRGGLGIGLYQAARQAESSGYRLALETNRDGEVSFTLSGPAA